MNLIEVSDVVKQFPGHRALDHVSLNVERGSVHGLLGPNGAGKTTLIRILNCILEADEGSVTLDGKPISQSLVRHIGYMPEERGLYKKMKVLDHIVFLGRLKGMTANDARIAARQWLQRMDLAEWENKKIEELSKGMAQKVQFIGTVLHKPELLIFDEPFSGFDPVNAEGIKKEILRLNAEGATILFSTHNMASVEEICRDVTLINHSRVALDGRVDAIRHRFKKNQFNVTVAEPVIAPAPELFEIEELAPGDPALEISSSHARIRIKPDTDLRSVIDHINSHYTLRSFEELLPSMHEVFIETVTDNENGQA